MLRSDVLAAVWHRAMASQPPPALSTVYVAATIGLALVLVPAAWPYSRHLVTITHEAAHGVGALLSGRRLQGIRLHSDTSGLTLSRGRPTGLGMIVTTAAGYIGPGLVGLGAALLLKFHHPVGLLWLAIVLLALMLIQIRNWFGLWSIVLAAVVVLAVSWWASAVVQTGFAYTATWFLLLAAPRPVLELQRSRYRGQAPDSDADMLARLTWLPGLVWVGAFLAVTLATLVIGAGWLLAR